MTSNHAGEQADDDCDSLLIEGLFAKRITCSHMAPFLARFP